MIGRSRQPSAPVRLRLNPTCPQADLLLINNLPSLEKERKEGRKKEKKEKKQKKERKEKENEETTQPDIKKKTRKTKRGPNIYPLILRYQLNTIDAVVKLPGPPASLPSPSSGGSWSPDGDAM